MTERGGREIEIEVIGYEYLCKNESYCKPIKLFKYKSGKHRPYQAFKVTEKSLLQLMREKGLLNRPLIEYQLEDDLEKIGVRVKDE